MTNNFFTQVVHAGQAMPQPDFKSVSLPIYPSVAYTYEDTDTLEAIFANEQPGYVYRRYGNPTVNAFEEAVATLEGGEAAYASGSGMAAVYGAVLTALQEVGTDRAYIVAAQDCYGATYTVINKQLAQFGVPYTFTDFTDLAALQMLIEKEQATILICETASNPLLRLVDIEAIAEMAHKNGALLIVDNTFPTPYLCCPLQLGADFVVHSATKYLGGHDDLLAGVVVTSSQRRHNLFEINKSIGANLSPFDAWLALRGLKTLALRMRQHCQNALQVATWLTQQPTIERVNYPGLPTHPQYALAQQLYGNKGFGGMLSFEIKGATQESIFRFMERLNLIQPATTLGDVYSLLVYPTMSSHRALTPQQRQVVGINDNLVRLSVGIEAAEDIIADLEQALSVFI